MSGHLRAEAPSVGLGVRLSPAERERVDQAAAANHQTVSQFARDALVTAADDCLEPPPMPHS
jgi:uncharacterized protein (DUF1778 family)